MFRYIPSMIRYVNKTKIINKNINYKIKYFSTENPFYHAADKKTIKFPREREGLNYELNWSLAKDNITPYGDAFSNYDIKKLFQISQTNIYEGKQSKIQIVDKDINLTAYSDIYDKVCEYLSSSDQLFIHDGAIGSHINSRTNVRIITDSPLFAAVAQKLLIKIPLKSLHTPHPICVYAISKKLDYINENIPSCLLIDVYDENENNKRQNISNKFYSKILFNGLPDLSTFMSDISLANTKVIENNATIGNEAIENISLPCDTMIDNETGKTFMLFNMNETERKKILSLEKNTGNMKVYSAHYSIWNKFGITNMFGGAVVTSDDKIKKDNVECISENSKKHSVISFPVNNLVSSPESLNIIYPGAGSRKEISFEDAKDKLDSFKQHSDIISTILKEKKIKIFLMDSMDQLVKK